jgi:phosphoribosylformylglycinamidine (FGAM) synthase-like amidotransferase family enzyme
MKNTSSSFTFIDCYNIWIDMKKQFRLVEEAKKQGRFANKPKFEVDEVVYNKRTKNVGIVRIAEERGEVKTDADGNVSNVTNPNGTIDYIAGICNAGKNVFGMMPHPERATNAILGNIDGTQIFESLILN